MDILPQKKQLPQVISDLLRQRIGEGEWTTVLPGERELARQMQVSRGSVRAAMEILVVEGVLEPGKQGSSRTIHAQHASGSRRTSEAVVAYAVPNRLSEVPAIVLRRVDALREHLAGAGIRMEAVIAREFYQKSPQRSLERLSKAHQADVWILFQAPKEVQRWFFENDGRCVIDGPCAEGVDFPSIDADIRATAFHAGGVLRRSGHERVALLLNDDRLISYDAITEGLKEGLGEMGPELVVIEHQADPDAVCTCLDRLMARKNRPTAIVSSRIATTVTAHTYLLSQSKPGAPAMSLLSLVSDHSIGLMVPKVSTYHISSRSYTRRLLRLVLEELESPRRPGRVVRLLEDYVPGATVEKLG